MQAGADEITGLGQHPIAVERVEILVVDVQNQVDRLRSRRGRQVRNRSCLGDIEPGRHAQLGADDLVGVKLEVADLLGVTVLEDLEIVFGQGW